MKHKIAIIISVIFSLNILILGIIGQVGFITIISRIFIYTPIFAGMIFLALFLIDMWSHVDSLDLHEDIDNVTRSRKKSKKQKTSFMDDSVLTQATELGKSLDIQESSPIDIAQSHPEKAAKAIREMLASDEK